MRSAIGTHGGSDFGASKQASFVRSFSRLLGGQRSTFLLAALASSILGGTEGALHPLLMKAIFDAAAQRESFVPFIYLIMGYLCLGLVANIGGYFLGLWEIRIDNRVVSDLSEDLLRSFYSVRYADVLRNGSGHYIARVRSDVKEGVVPMLSMTRTVSKRAVTFVALIGVLVAISWQALLALIVALPVATFVSLKIGGKIRSLTSHERDDEASLIHFLSSAVAAFRIVSSFNLVEKTVGPFREAMHRSAGSTYTRSKAMRTLVAASDVTMVICDICSMLVGAFFVFFRGLTIGSFIAFMNAFWRSASSLIDVFKLSADLHTHFATCQRVLRFLDDVDPVALEPSDHLILSRLTFSYGDEVIIDDLSMEAWPGQKVLILGSNGSGKTTLANIMAGYLLPGRGVIRGPASISAVTLPLAFPPIIVGEMGADIRLLETFGLAAAHLLGGLPDRLSVGQQQKLALALALSRESDLYVLDEPMANLDLETRAVAMAHIFERTKGKILVLIMHGGAEYHEYFDQVYRLPTTSHGSVVQADIDVPCL